MDARHESFLEYIAQALSPTAAARKAGCSVKTLYKRRREDREFEERWAEAYESGTHVLEDAAKKRAMRTSDTLMIFLLKSRDPAKYREQRDPGGGQTQVNINFVRDPTTFAPPVVVTGIGATEVTRYVEHNAPRVRELTSIGNDMLSDVSEAAQGIAGTMDLKEEERRSVKEAEDSVRRHNEAVRLRSIK
jgi:hypothetical protein